MLKSICAVIVTYNRKELLLRNLNAVLMQEYPLDILIFDNCSTDGTKEYLTRNGIMDLESVHYHQADTNLGGAGGFSQGMKIAYEKGFDMIWLMDDDGYCYDSNTLKKLIARIPDGCDEYILNSTVICNDKRTLTFGFENIGTYEQLKKVSRDGVYDGYINPFNGTLITKECINKIGFPKGEFFIYGDEHEYMLRAKKNGILVRTVLDSLYFHPVNRKIQYHRVWRYDIPIKNEPVWKTFCDVRNSIYITRHYDNYKMLLIKIYIVIVSAMIKDNKKNVYLKYTLLGIWDGLRAKFDRPIMFDK